LGRACHDEILIPKSLEEEVRRTYIRLHARIP
jgi:hypothetical protein